MRQRKLVFLAANLDAAVRKGDALCPVAPAINKKASRQGGFFYRGKGAGISTGELFKKDSCRRKVIGV